MSKQAKRNPVGKWILRELKSLRKEYPGAVVRLTKNGWFSIDYYGKRTEIFSEDMAKKIWANKRPLSRYNKNILDENQVWEEGRPTANLPITYLYTDKGPSTPKDNLDKVITDTISETLGLHPSLLMPK